MAGRLENLSQTLINIGLEKDIETILIHDKQDSLTSQELRDLVLVNPHANITLVERYLGSPGGARNLGMTYITGKWVNFVDSDDIFYPTRLIRELRENFASNVCAVVSNYETIDSETNLVTQNCHRESLTAVALNPGIWRWALNRECIGEAKFSDSSMGEDQRFLYEFCKKNANIVFISATTYRYTTNLKFQLTNQRKAKDDLTLSLSDLVKIRQSNQDHFSEFSETLILKLFLSCLIHTSIRNKHKSFAIFIPVLSPFSKTRLRISKLRLRRLVQ